MLYRIAAILVVAFVQAFDYFVADTMVVVVCILENRVHFENLVKDAANDNRDLVVVAAVAVVVHTLGYDSCKAMQPHLVDNTCVGRNKVVPVVAVVADP